MRRLFVFKFDPALLDHPRLRGRVPIDVWEVRDASVAFRLTEELCRKHGADVTFHLAAD